MRDNEPVTSDSDPPRGQVTELLAAIGEGDPHAADELGALYEVQGRRAEAEAVPARLATTVPAP
jgi:hypothetical protein